jgi:hypothetical protein
LDVPYLDITDGKGGIYWRADLKVFSRMLFPDDEMALYQWLIVVGLDADKHRLEPSAEFPLPSTPISVLELAANAPEAEKVMRQAADCARQGEIAGHILLTVLSLSNFAPEQATIGKAIWIESAVQVKEQMQPALLALSRHGHGLNACRIFGLLYCTSITLWIAALGRQT